MQITRNSLDTGTGPNDWFRSSGGNGVHGRSFASRFVLEISCSERAGSARA